MSQSRATLLIGPTYMQTIPVVDPESAKGGGTMASAEHGTIMAARGRSSQRDPKSPWWGFDGTNPIPGPQQGLWPRTAKLEDFSVHFNTKDGPKVEDLKEKTACTVYLSLR